MERIKQLADFRSQIEKINGEISGLATSNDLPSLPIDVDEFDLSLRKIGEYQSQLQTLQKEKVMHYD